MYFVDSKIADTPCGAQGRYNPGLRYYDPNTRLWQAGSPPNVPTHPLLLEHGIFSCVEGTFPSALVERYRAEGAYDFINGYDYDWLKNPTDIAPQIQGAVDQFGFQHLDIFAHSYGTINVLATIPTLAAPTQIDNLVLYDGPLDGALIANDDTYLGELASSEKLSIARNANKNQEASFDRLVALTDAPIGPPFLSRRLLICRLIETKRWH